MKKGFVLNLGKVNLHMTNRVAYTLIAILVLTIVAVFVYAQGTVSHDASEIIGTLSVTQIPNLDANKITSGELSLDRISDLGSLATKNNVDWNTEVINKPTFSGDNLGNHVATQPIKLWDIYNAPSYNDCDEPSEVGKMMLSTWQKPNILFICGTRIEYGEEKVRWLYSFLE
jgi:hypothetical protein